MVAGLQAEVQTWDPSNMKHDIHLADVVLYKILLYLYLYWQVYMIMLFLYTCTDKCVQSCYTYVPVLESVYDNVIPVFYTDKCILSCYTCTGKCIWSYYTCIPVLINI
jgi:hypothetical protein